MMKIKNLIKTEEEIDFMRKSGNILATTFRELEHYVKPGLSTMELNKKGDEIIRKLGGIPAFLNYEGFPASFCISVNDQVVHGIPHEKHFIDEGDIVSIDGGVIFKGMYTDAARTFPVGRVSSDLMNLINATKESFFEGIKKAKPGNFIGEISETIGNYIETSGYSAVRELSGHGIGKHLHEEPYIYNFKQKNKGLKIEKNMTFAIEPIVNMGVADIVWGEDEWTVYTEDYSYSAHYENTIRITEGEPEILTL